MSAVSTEDITARLTALKVNDASKIVEHAAVKNGQEWREALQEKAEGVILTKTVSTTSPFHTDTSQPPVTAPVQAQDRENSRPDSGTRHRKGRHRDVGRGNWKALEFKGIEGRE